MVSRTGQPIEDDGRLTAARRASSWDQGVYSIEFAEVVSVTSVGRDLNEPLGLEDFCKSDPLCQGPRRGQLEAFLKLLRRLRLFLLWILLVSNVSGI